MPPPGRHRESVARLLFRQLRAIASSTATELLETPAVLLLTLTGVLATALIPVLQLHQFDEPGRLPRDGGLAYQLVIGLVLAVVSASASFHDEIENGTASAALAKPVDRYTFLVGKWLGVLSVTFRFWFCILATTMLAERITERFVTVGEFRYVTDSAAQLAVLLVPILSLVIAGVLHNRRHLRFCKTAAGWMTILSAIALAMSFLFDREAVFAPSFANTNLRIVPVSLLVFAALAVYSAIATALATRLRTAPALVLSFLLLGLGLSADTLLAPTTPFLVRLPAYLLPNLQTFWMCDALANGGSLAPGYLLGALVYATALCLVALGAAMPAFRERDIG